jgi:hypothetical protein
VEEAKVALLCGDENSPVLDSVLAVKGIVTPPQTQQHGSSNIMAVLCEELTERQGNAFVQGEAGHTLHNGRGIALNTARNFCLVPCGVTL